MTVGAEFEICLAPEFWDQLLRLPRNVGKSIAASALPRLRTQPDQADPPAIKKLVGWEGLWRYRKGAYRLIYQVDTEAREVTLRLAGHRGTIYDELGHVPDEGPSIRVLRSMPDLVAEERTAELVDLDHEVTEGTASEPADITGEIEERLPEAIGTEMLEECRVAPDYRRVFSGVETAGELMALAPKVPEDQLCRVLSRLYPPAVSELFDGPRHVVESDEDVESALEEGRPIESFLLRLDEQQKVLVDRFEQPSPTGPWIVKGGPGTGKSTIALYCIRNLLKPEQVDYLAEPRPMQVLFTTYTKSLTALARHLLSHLRA